MISARTLKLLATLNFHQKIVNRVEIHKGKVKEITSPLGDEVKKGQEIYIHSVSEDGYYAQWTLVV